MTNLELVSGGYNFVAIKKVGEFNEQNLLSRRNKWNEKDCLFWPGATV